MRFKGPEDLGDRQGPVHGLTTAMRRPNEQPHAEILLAGVVPFQVPPSDRWALSPADTISAERAVAERINLLAIGAQASFDALSPRPYIFLEPQSDAERERLDEVDRVDLPKLRLGVARLAPGVHRSDVDFGAVLGDRPHGVALMGAALAAAQGIAKLHELIRVFENAFAVGGGRLIDPLTDFLRSHQWELGYTRGEVRGWIRELRDPATHADRARSQVLLDPDVEPRLPRIEQAAYDVLFNKRHWHRSDSQRLDRWGFASMIDRDGGSIVSEGGMLGGLDEWDHMRAFRLDERYRIEEMPPDWHAVDWYFPDPPD